MRNRRHFRRMFFDYQSAFRTKLFGSNDAIQVQSGPFKDLRYINETVWGSITPKWLGSYEAELHPVVNHIVQRAYSVIIDVGCAEGYYAVGLAVAIPGANVFAFDTDFISRSQVRRLAALNNVEDRLHINSFCSHSDLDKLSGRKTLVVCDIEGFEAQLLDPKAAPSLIRNDILVEVHEAPPTSTEVENLLKARFESTHHIERIDALSRDTWIANNTLHSKEPISKDELKLATEEHRGTGLVWLWMQAKQSV